MLITFIFPKNQNSILLKKNNFVVVWCISVLMWLFLFVSFFWIYLLLLILDVKTYHWSIILNMLFSFSFTSTKFLIFSLRFSMTLSFNSALLNMYISVSSYHVFKINSLWSFRIQSYSNFSKIIKICFVS